MGTRGLRAVCAAIAVATAGCWLQPGFDAGRTNWNAGESGLTSATVGDAVELWSTDTGTGAVDTAPLSFNGSVVAVARPDVAGQPSKAVRLDAATGASTWTTALTPVGTSAAGSPVVQNGTVLVPSGVVNGPGVGHFRVDAASGALLGRAGPAQTQGMAVADKRVATLWKYTGLGNGWAGIEWKYQPLMRADFGDIPYGRTFAFVGDRIMWSVGQYALGYSPACPDHPVYPDFCNPDWLFVLGGNAVAVARLGSDGVVYVDSTGTVTALDATTGALRWRGAAGAGVSKPPAVTDGSVLVTTDDNRLVAISTADGTTQWQASLGGAATSGPVAAGDVVYVAVGADVVAFASTGCGGATCAAVTTLAVGTAVTGGPIVDGGRVVVGTADGRVVAFGVIG